MTISTDPVYHAGDLIGFTKNGREIYLPGGGAEITVDDGDEDELDVDALDRSLAEDPDPGDDDDDDGDGGEGDPEAVEEEPPPVPARPSYRTLMAELAKLRDGQRRNNQELAKRRHLGKWMEEHGIEDLDAWLVTLGVDKATGKQITPAQAEQAAAAVAADKKDQAEQQEPAGSSAASNVDETELRRQIRLEVEKDTARSNERADKLTQALRQTAIEAALSKAQFSGTVDKAMKLLEHDKITVDDDGKVVGADEAVQSLREEIPEWFRRRPAVPVEPVVNGGTRVDGGDKGRPAPRKARWDEQVVDRLRGTAR